MPILSDRGELDNPILMEQVLKDFRNFLYRVWKHLNLPAPTPVQYEIAEWLQSGVKRQIIEAFRGVGKSWITSAFVLWTLLRDPQAKVLVVSASKQRSDDFSSFTLRLINEMPILRHLRPKDDQRNSKIAFDVAPALPAHAPSVKSVGVFGQMAGSRATHIIADDVEIPNNSETQDKREKLIRAVSEFEAIIVPGGRITYLGTPQTEESIYTELRRRGYEARIWPSRVPIAEKVKAYEGALAPTIQARVDAGESGSPTDPKRFDEMDLTEREGVYGRSGFALQFMLDTSLSDAERYPLKLSDLVVTSINSSKAPILFQYGTGPENQIPNLPNVGFSGDRWYKPFYVDNEWAEYEGSVMAIDPSGRGTDETAYAVVKQLHGYLFLTRSGGFQGGYEDTTLMGLARIARDEKVNQILVEDNFGDGMFSKLFQPVLNRYHRCSIEEVKHHTQKEVRIIGTLEPLMNRHKLIVDHDLVKNDLKKAEEDLKYSLFYQMTRLTKDRGALKHDDRLDALAIAVRYWTDSMARDENDAVQEHRRRELDKELEIFMEHALGKESIVGGIGKTNWMYGSRKGTALAQNSRKWSK